MPNNGISVRFAELNGEVRTYLVEEGTTVEDFIDIVDIDTSDKKIHVNDEVAESDDVLQNGDMVTLIDKISGGR